MKIVSNTLIQFWVRIQKHFGKDIELTELMSWHEPLASHTCTHFLSEFLFWTSSVGQSANVFTGILLLAPSGALFDIMLPLIEFSFSFTLYNYYNIIIATQDSPCFACTQKTTNAEMLLVKSAPNEHKNSRTQQLSKPPSLHSLATLPKSLQTGNWFQSGGETWPWPPQTIKFSYKEVFPPS